MVSDALRQVMIEAEGAGELPGEGVLRGAAEHPVCGDQVMVDLRLRDGVIADLAWRASGCPACMAVAAAAPAALRGRAPGDLAGALSARLQSLGGLATHERHAERMFLRAVQEALAGAGSGGGG